MFKPKGGGSKAFWTMFKKTALFLKDGFPNDTLETLLIVFLPSRQIQSEALKIENMAQDIGPIVTLDSRCLDSRLM